MLTYVWICNSALLIIMMVVIHKNGSNPLKIVIVLFYGQFYAVLIYNTVTIHISDGHCISPLGNHTKGKDPEESRRDGGETD